MIIMTEVGTLLAVMAMKRGHDVDDLEDASEIHLGKVVHNRESAA
jgi:hypothetical protein